MHTTRENHHITKEGSKREKKEQRYYRTPRKQLVKGNSNSISINNCVKWLNVKGIHSPMKRNRMAE